MKELIELLFATELNKLRKGHIAPSVVFAQGLLESANGTSELAKNANNYFGIKKGSGWTGETYTKRTKEQDKDGNEFEVTAEFRKYGSLTECVEDLIWKYNNGTGWETHNRYESVLGNQPYKEITNNLLINGYATDKKYPEKLNAIIEKYNLNLLDTGIVDYIPEPKTEEKEERPEMVNIKQQLVPSHLVSKVSYPVKNKKRTIIIHETANTSKGANAKSHANLQSRGNARAASWHYQCGSDGIYQSFKHDVSCWAAGSYIGNTEGIQIEICVNRDGDFKKAVANAVALTQHIMKVEGITINNVKMHRDYSGKNCPTNLINGSKGIDWNDFINSVKNLKAPKPSVVQGNKTEVEQIKTLAESLNYYTSPRWTNPAGTVPKGTVLTIDSIVEVEGAKQYKTISGTYITANEKYVQPIKKQEPKPDLVKIDAAHLNYYDSPRWTNPTGTVKAGDVFTVIKKVKVDGGEQYKLKSGTYITANPKYVTKL